jgi:hypothetical protein
MFNLFFNERKQTFTVKDAKESSSTMNEGSIIMRSESDAELIGVAKGLMAARFCVPPYYILEPLTLAVNTSLVVNR